MRDAKRFEHQVCARGTLRGVKTRKPVLNVCFDTESTIGKTDAGAGSATGSETVVIGGIEHGQPATAPPQAASPGWARIPRCNQRPRLPPLSMGWQDTSVPARCGLESCGFAR